MILFRLLRQLRRVRKKKSIGLYTVLGLLATSIFGNALCFYFFERSGNEELGVDDALWYSMVSITTIGYGDYYPETMGGRIGAVFFVMVLGLGAFTVILGMAIDWIADYSLRERRGMSTIVAKDHILIVNFPSHERVSQLIEELKADASHHNRDIVIISDNVTELPIDDEQVFFVAGSVLHKDTYVKACVDECKMAIILATNYSDPNSDAVVASAISVINSLEPDIHIVAECLNEQHRMLYKSVRCEAIVFSLRISANLLAQEINDPGVIQLIDTITSNVRGTTLYTTGVPDIGEGSLYSDLAKRLLDRDINVISVCRGDESITSLSGLNVQSGDRIVYAASRRYTYSDLLDHVA